MECQTETINYDLFFLFSNLERERRCREKKKGMKRCFATHKWREEQQRVPMEWPFCLQRQRILRCARVRILTPNDAKPHFCWQFVDLYKNRMPKMRLLNEKRVGEPFRAGHINEACYRPHSDSHITVNLIDSEGVVNNPNLLRIVSPWAA